MRHDLQLLRDQAGRECKAAFDRGDRDSSDAWERIGNWLDEVQARIKHDWRTIEQRRPASEPYRSEAEVAAERLSDLWLLLDTYARGGPLPRETAAQFLRHQQCPGWK